MTKPDLDQAQIDTGFEQVGGPGMTQGVDSGWFGERELLDGGVEGVLKTTGGHRGAGSGAVASSGTASGKQPAGVAVGAPVVTQEREGAWRERDIAVFIAFATLDMQLHTRAIDLRDLEVDAFKQA